MDLNIIVYKNKLFDSNKDIIEKLNRALSRKNFINFIYFLLIFNINWK